LRLYPEGFFEVFLAVPPIGEQRAIVAHIAAETAKLDAMRSATERTIALLKERRAALIAAAVTGAIDVREEIV
jgi:type I restriction enzyme S subunit